MKKRNARFAAVLLALVMLMTACSSSDQGGQTTAATTGGETTSGSATTTEASTTQAASGEKVSLKMIDSLANDNRTAALQKIIDDFTAANQNITVELISPPTDGADQKIQQMLMAGEQLDLIDTGNSFQACINNNWVQPLNSYLAGWDEMSTITAEAYSRMIVYGKADETIWLVPYGIYEKLLFYRSDWFEEAGLNPPTTWEEIYQYGMQLTDPSQNRYGWATRGGARGYAVFDMLMLSFVGSDLLVDNESYTYFTNDGRNVFETDEAYEALEFYKKLYTDISPSDSISWGFTEMVQGFMSGTVAMLLQDNDVIMSCEDGMEEGTWSATVLPLGPSGQGASPLGYGGWALTSHTEHAAEAVSLLKSISSADSNGYFCSKTGLIPIHTTTLESDPLFSTGVYDVFSQMSAMEGKYIYSGGGGIGYDCSATFATDRDEYLQKYMLGQVEAADLLEYWAQTWRDAYEAQGQLW